MTNLISHTGRMCIAFTIFLLASVGLSGHPYHVSSCRIDFNAETGGLEIALQLSTEDFEQAVEAEDGVLLKLGLEDEAKDSERIIQAFLARHLKLKVDGVQVELKYLGKEVSIDDTWCYLEVVGLKQPREIIVFNDLLIAQFETQSNIVRAKVGSIEQATILQKGSLEQTLTF